MCGIAGIIQVNPSAFDKGDLKKMTDAIAHRGPDGESFWQNDAGNVLLGHRRLCIIDLTPAAAQPMHYRDRYTILHNGEIYNYIELREELQKAGYSFRTQSDTEVILAAYDHWSDECVDHFDGMFAFAIWDEQEKELFAARDRFGEKPFYYYFDGKTLLFASEMKALWAAGVPKEPNLQLHFNFITIGYVDNPAQPEETFYKNIFRLPPASVLFYSWPDSELVAEKYWDIDPGTRDKNISETDAMERFDELFAISVKRRLRSDVSIGISLSGGLDSSAIAASLSAITGNSFPSFTASFPGYDKDETAFAGMVAGKFGLASHVFPVEPEGLIKDWDKLCRHQEEPFGSASIYAQYKVYEQAAQNKVTVLLDGQGADETLAGYHKYYKWYWQELFIKRKLLLSGELRAAAAIGVKEKFNARNIIASLFPDLASVVLEKQYLLKALRHEDLTRDFVREQSKEAYYSTPSHYNLNGILYFNSCVHGLEELLRYADRNAMAHGREVRLPFLSHELAEFIFSLPAHFKIRDGWTKWLLRKSMDQQLPKEIAWRKDKIGFEPPQSQWMKNPGMTDMVHAARKKLVSEKILVPGVLNKPIMAASAHAAENNDWRYLAVAAFL